ncbi:MAG TPA: hypothetical protein VH538_04325, partial [Gaiellaceae bacterium]
LALKELTADVLNAHLRPLRERREQLAADPGYLRSVLHAGNERARAIAAETLAVVRELMHTDYRTEAA